MKRVKEKHNTEEAINQWFFFLFWAERGEDANKKKFPKNIFWELPKVQLLTSLVAPRWGGGGRGGGGGGGGRGRRNTSEFSNINEKKPSFCRWRLNHAPKIFWLFCCCVFFFSPLPSPRIIFLSNGCARSKQTPFFLVPIQGEREYLSFLVFFRPMSRRDF